MHKNFVGTALSFAAIVAYLSPDWVGWTRRWSRAALLVAGPRNAADAVAPGPHRPHGRRRRRRDPAAARRVARALVLLLLIPAVVAVINMVADQIASQNQHNSVFQRLDWFREVFRYWRESPVFGHGLRYWYTEPTAPYQPPQAEMEVLASAGVVGLIGFIVMWIGVLVVLWRIDPRFGTLAVAVMLARIVQAQFDLFWVAAQVSIPFVIAGICLGAMAHEQRDPRLDDADGAACGADLRKPDRAVSTPASTALSRPSAAVPRRGVRCVDSLADQLRAR